MASIIETLIAMELKDDLSQVVAVVALSFFLCTAVTAAPIWPSHWTVLNRSYLTSTVHAFISVALALRALSIILASPRSYDMFPASAPFAPLFPGGSSAGWDVKDNVGDSMWKADMPTARLGIAVTLGYMLCDSALAVAFPGHLDKFMVLHHALVVVSVTASLLTNTAIAYSCILLVNEASTPFVNVFFVTKDSWKGLRVQINGFLMWLSYAVFRIAFNTVVGVSMVQTLARSTVFATHPLLTCLYVGSFAAAQCLNANWFYRITRGLIKAVCGRKPHPGHGLNKHAHLEAAQAAAAAAIAGGSAADVAHAAAHARAHAMEADEAHALTSKANKERTAALLAAAEKEEEERTGAAAAAGEGPTSGAGAMPVPPAPAAVEAEAAAGPASSPSSSSGVRQRQKGGARRLDS